MFLLCCVVGAGVSVVVVIFVLVVFCCVLKCPDVFGWFQGAFPCVLMCWEVLRCVRKRLMRSDVCEPLI